MYIVICDNPEGEPDLLGPFETDQLAQSWIDSRIGHECPNDHYWLEVIPVTFD